MNDQLKALSKLLVNRYGVTKRPSILKRIANWLRFITPNTYAFSLAGYTVSFTLFLFKHKLFDFIGPRSLELCIEQKKSNENDKLYKRRWYWEENLFTLRVTPLIKTKQLKHY